MITPLILVCIIIVLVFLIAKKLFSLAILSGLLIGILIAMAYFGIII
jgi:hypothetical protein